jgi:hypothetical protein
MWLKSLKGGKHVENVGVDRRIILRYFSIKMSQKHVL